MIFSPNRAQEFVKIEEYLAPSSPDAFLKKKQQRVDHGFMSPKLERINDISTRDLNLVSAVSQPQLMPKDSSQVGGSEVQSKFLNNAYFK